MRLSGQFWVCLYFFYEKILSAQKHAQSKNQLTKQNKRTLHNNGNKFSPAQKLLRGWKSFVLHFCTFLCSRFFRTKRINRLEIVLITSYTLLPTCTPLNPPIENLFVRTYFYLWSCVRISSFNENLFESFLSVRIFSCLRLYVTIYDQLWESIF